MTCPPEIAAIVADILKLGLVRIRNGSISPAQMQVEADFLHHLPDILGSYDPLRLWYYWDTERICYLRNLDPTRNILGMETC